MNDKLLFGVGINDLGLSSKDPFFQCWRNMLDRCYGPAERKSFFCYEGCEVAREWLVLSVFREWMLRQNWREKQLDKDILFPGNKLYSPEACVFVDAQTNTVLNTQLKSRGKYPLGVSFDKSRGCYQAQIKRNCRAINLGRFSNPMDAHTAWQREKAAIIREIAVKQTDWRVKAALFGRADQLDTDRMLNMETTKL